MPTSTDVQDHLDRALALVNRATDLALDPAGDGLFAARRLVQAQELLEQAGAAPADAPAPVIGTIGGAIAEAAAELDAIEIPDPLPPQLPAARAELRLALLELP